MKKEKALYIKFPLEVYLNLKIRFTRKGKKEEQDLNV